MGTPIGVYTKDLVDIGTIFKPYIGGTKNLNSFFTKNSVDIGTLLQPWLSGTQTVTGLYTKNKIDIGTLFQTDELPFPLTDYTNIISTGAKAFSYLAMPGENRTLLNYVTSFGVVGTSSNNGTGSWDTSYSGNLSYTASPITNVSYFTKYNRVRVIDGDGASSGVDWAVFNFGLANGGGDFDGTSNTNAYFGGENSYSGGTGGVASTGYVWGFSISSGWNLLYQLPLGSTSGPNYNHTNGGWFTSGGTIVTSGNGKRSAYDSLTIAHMGFSVV
jgi:hypothetical protein